MLRVRFDEADNILHVDGAIGKTWDPEANPRAACKFLLNDLAQNEFPRAKATRPQFAKDDLIGTYEIYEISCWKSVDSDMDEVWFSNSNVTKGARIISWECDNDGIIIDTSSIPSSTLRPPLSESQGITFSPNDCGSFRSSEVEASLKGQLATLSDHDLRVKLDSLIRDAKETFQYVMRRNSDLEQELDYRRSRSEPEVGLVSGSEQCGSRTSQVRSHLPLRLPLPRDLHDHSVFDISTPPTHTRIQRASDSPSIPQTLHGLTQRPNPIPGNRGHIRTTLIDR